MEEIEQKWVCVGTVQTGDTAEAPQSLTFAGFYFINCHGNQSFITKLPSFWFGNPPQQEVEHKRIPRAAPN